MKTVYFEKSQIYPYYAILPDNYLGFDSFAALLTDDEYKRILEADDEFYACQDLIKSKIDGTKNSKNIHKRS